MELGDSVRIVKVDVDANPDLSSMLKVSYPCRSGVTHAYVTQENVCEEAGYASKRPMSESRWQPESIHYARCVAYFVEAWVTPGYTSRPIQLWVCLTDNDSDIYEDMCIPASNAPWTREEKGGRLAVHSVLWSRPMAIAVDHEAPRE